MSAPIKKNAVWEMVRTRMPAVASLITCTSIPSQGKALVMGQGIHHVFDPHSQTWTRLPPMPTLWFGCASACHGNTIYVMGGAIYGNYNTLYSNLVHAITVDNPSWKRMPSMLTERGHCVAAVVDNGIVVAGGCNWSSNHIAQVELFCLPQQEWIRLPSMPHRKSSFAMVAVRNRLLVFGGLAPDGTRLDTVECLDLDAKTWESLPPMPRRRAWASAVAVGRFVLILGGRDQGWLSAVDGFDTVCQEWIAGMPSLRTARSPCPAALIRNDFYVFGGVDQEGSRVDTMEKIAVDPYWMVVFRLQPLLQQEEVLLGLWPHILAGQLPSVVYSILQSERFQLDSVF